MSLRSLGLDIGSRTVKAVFMQGQEIIWARKCENSFDPLEVCRKLIAGTEYDCLIATGYGRHLFRQYQKCEVISEISAFVSGVRFIYPACRTILDIGGQDTKVISITSAGKLAKFEMNDKCAAGTGRFLEIMATALGFSMMDFIAAALEAKHPEKINNMCTVFAESEVISLTAKGANRNNVALGIHLAIVRRSLSMLKRLNIEADLVFAGGVAWNQAVCKLLTSELNMPLLIPPDPQIVGALGCALYGYQQKNKVS